ncbi:MAG TPA: hypothetical protein VLM38_02030 [Blastocatellia bacterium]|nr:hypothetical protein [Blastocatellia bacterium]
MRVVQGPNAGRSLQVSLISLLLSVSLSVSMVAGIPSGTARGQSVQTILTLDLSALPSPANIQLLGASPNDHLSGGGTAGSFSALPRAHALAVGDFNKDGFGDAVVGAPDTDFTPSGGAARVDAGAVYILFGKATFASPTIVDTNTTALSQPDVKIFGALAGDNLGFAVSAGDVNGDGFDDLSIGAPGFDLTLAGPPPVDRQNCGAVYILFGSASFGAATIDLGSPNAANVLVVGEAAGDRFGSALTIRDVNGATSAPDLLVGAPSSQGPDPVAAARADGGAAYLLFGGTPLANPAATTKTIDLGQAAMAAPVRVFGKTGSRLGCSVAIGDVNAGGASDVIVGAPTANRPNPAGDVTETGAVFVVFGGDNLNPAAPATTKTFDINTGQQNVSIYGASANDHLGASVTVGDVNNDGTTDLEMGAPDADGPGDLRTDAGECYVIVAGDPFAPGARIDVGISTVSLTIYGSASGDHLGATVAVGVINTTGNTDLAPDLMIGSPGALSGKGTVSILFGGSSLLFFAVRDIADLQDDVRVVGQAAGDELGWAIAAGDLDNNHGGDLLLGAPFNDVPVAVASVRDDAGRAYVILAANQNVPPMNQNPTVTVTQPNGTEIIQGGTTFEIKWTASDPDGDETIQSFVIALSTDGGGTFNTTLAPNVAGISRVFNWNVPTGLNTTTARVRVTVSDNAGGQAQDASNANFTITDAGVPVVLTAPNGGEGLKWDQVFPVTWTVGMGLEDQVKGFDLFFTTDGGTTFTAITPVNPTQPALAKEVRSFNWTVPRFCENNTRVLVRATSVTGAVSSDSSNAGFTIAQPAPQIDTAFMFFTKGNKQINFFTLPNTQPVFLEGVKLEISGEGGGAFSEVPNVVVKQGGTKLISKGRIGDQRIGVFFPEGAHRIIRITNGQCGVVLLLVHRTGQEILLDTAAAGSAPGSRTLN